MGLSRATVLETIIQIQTLAHEFIENQRRYGSLIPDDPDTNPALEISSELRHACDHAESRLLKVGSHRTPSSLRFIKRLKWAVCDKDKFGAFVNRFVELNDALVDLVDSEARSAIRQSTRETNIGMLHIHNRVDELVDLIKALAPETNPVSTGQPQILPSVSGLSSLQGKHDLASLAYTKAVKTALDGEVHFNAEHRPHTGVEILDFKLQRSSIEIIPTEHATCERSDALYHTPGERSRRVWVEWREYDVTAHQEILQNQRDDSLDGSPSNTPTRIDKLVAMLNDPHKPPSLRAPRCLGYFDNSTNDRLPGASLGFVLSIPTQTATSPLSLRQLIHLRTKPSLTDRIALAKAIANCLMSLHSVNWLHKGLRSHNIVLFPDSTTDDVDYASPTLSGFGYSRPAYRDDMTETPSRDPTHDMYRHPSVHGMGPYESRQGFKRTCDIYALGVMLVEIAHWECVEQILGIENPAAAGRKVLSGIRQRLVGEEQYMDAVGANAGQLFRGATVSCLMGADALGVADGDDEMDAHVAAKLSTNFSQKVLWPLDRINT